MRLFYVFFLLVFAFPSFAQIIMHAPCHYRDDFKHYQILNVGIFHDTLEIELMHTIDNEPEFQLQLCGTDTIQGFLRFHLKLLPVKDFEISNTIKHKKLYFYIRELKTVENYEILLCIDDSGKITHYP